MKASGGQWNELRATQSLKETAALVEGYRAYGVGITNAKAYHGAIRRAHGAQNRDAYEAALDAYLEAAREAYRRRQGGGG